ncbi:SIMPL domain-containing protein [Jatrophihabitans sp.]|uniref:SIMPL domain-containing protein n=1 Tax=Jatrophihabitans sp. TaxID=1932789 RepID=UPI002F11255C
MLTIARTTVPVAVAGLLLTACGGGGKAGPAPLATAPLGANPIGAAPDSAGASMGAAPMGGTGIDAAPMSGAAAVKAGLPMTAAAPLSVDAHTLTTRGMGKASGTPDTLTIMIGVSTQGSSAKAALDTNNAKANALIDLLRGRGVAAKDLQTRQLSINPTYHDKSGTISGYQVDNMVQATLHSIGSAGALLDAAAGAAGDAVRVQQIGFSIGDDSAMRAQARTQAVSQATAQAAQIAKAAGVTLGRIRSITELADAGYPISYDMRGAVGSASAPSVPLQAGQQELTISVDIVYDIS